MLGYLAVCVCMQEEEHRRLVEEKEAEVLRLAEAAEQARLEAEEASKEEKEEEQTQDAFAVISDLDNALKAFQGALGLSDVCFCFDVNMYMCMRNYH